MLNALLLTIGFVALAFVFLAVKILLKKEGRFPNSHIGANKKLAEKGISCAVSTDARERSKAGLTERINDIKNRKTV